MLNNSCYDPFDFIAKLALQGIIEQSKQFLDDVCCENESLPNSFYDEKISRLQNQMAKVKSEQEKLILKARTIKTFLRASNSALASLKKDLICPYTQKPLLEAIVVKTTQSALCMNASYLGFKREGSKLNEVSLVLSEEAQKIKEQMQLVYIDYTIANLTALVFKKNSSNQIHLEHKLLEDPIWFQPFENAQIMGCGHALSKKSIQNLATNQCPYCCSSIDKVKTISHPILNNIIKTLSPDFEKNLKLQKVGIQREIRALSLKHKNLGQEKKYTKDRLEAKLVAEELKKISSGQRAESTEEERPIQEKKPSNLPTMDSLVNETLSLLKEEIKKRVEIRRIEETEMDRAFDLIVNKLAQRVDNSLDEGPQISEIDEL